MKKKAFKLSHAAAFIIKGICCGFPKPCGIMTDSESRPLKMKQLLVVYPVNDTPADSKVKIWNVAVSTTEPAETFKTYNGWMRNILVERALTQANIADWENIRLRENVKFYSEKFEIDRTCCPIKTLLDHEGGSFKL